MACSSSLPVSWYTVFYFSLSFYTIARLFGFFSQLTCFYPITLPVIFQVDLILKSPIKCHIALCMYVAVSLVVGVCLCACWTDSSAARYCMDERERRLYYIWLMVCNSFPQAVYDFLLAREQRPQPHNCFHVTSILTIASCLDTENNATLIK